MTAPLALLMLAVASTSAFADPIPLFGSASAYNLVAIGSTGPYAITGNITTGSDIGGRVAAAGTVFSASQVGATPAVNDPYGYLTSFDFVSPGGYTGGTVNMQGSGNAYAPGASSSLFNFNGGGSLVTTGGSPINFSALQATVDSTSIAIGALSATGSVAVNGNDLVLTGTDPSLNIFNITAAQLAAATDQLEINAPQGSTIIVNVSGGSGGSTSIQVGKLSYNGQQVNGNADTDADILFNFYQAQSIVNLNGQFSASILAPFATVTGQSQLDGTTIAAAIDDTGEIHNEEFTGIIPLTPGNPSTTPEPSSIVLLATGLAGLAGAVRRRR